MNIDEKTTNQIAMLHKRFVIPVLSLTIATGMLLPVITVLTQEEAFAVTAAEKEAEAQSALQELNSLNGLLDDASAKYYQALSEYTEAVTKRDEVQSEIDEVNARLDDVRERLNDRVATMYKNGKSTIIDVFLNAETFDDFVNNWEMYNKLNENDAALAEEAQQLESQLEEKKSEYNQQVELADEKSNEASEAYAMAEEAVASMQSTYETLSAEAQELYAQEAAAQAAYEASLATQGGYQQGGYVNDDGTVTDIETGTVYSSPSEYSAQTGNAIVDRAYSMIGQDYVWGGVGGSWGGFDCSGLVSYALTGENTRLGTTATFANWNQVSDPQPGDVCVIHNDSHQHTGIYVGNGKMVHASTYGVGVIESDVQDGMIFVRP